MEHPEEQPANVQFLRHLIWAGAAVLLVGVTGCEQPTPATEDAQPKAALEQAVPSTEVVNRPAPATAKSLGRQVKWKFAEKQIRLALEAHIDAVVKVHDGAYVVQSQEYGKLSLKNPRYPDPVRQREDGVYTITAIFDTVDDPDAEYAVDFWLSPDPKGAIAVTDRHARALDPS